MAQVPPPLSQNLWDAFNMLPRRGFTPGGYNPNLPVGPGNVSPGMPGQNIPGYGTAQPGGAAPTLPPMSGYPGGMSPGMPGLPGPPIYGPPQTGGAAPSIPGSGHVPVINRYPPTGYPYWDAMQDFFHVPTQPPTPTCPDNPWYPPIMPGHPRMLPGTTPLAPAMISPGMFR